MLQRLCQRRRIFRWLVLVLLTLPAFGCAVFVAPAAAADKPIIQFGIIPRYNPMIMYRNYQPLMDYLTANTPYRFELKLSRDYPEAVAMLRSGATPVASLGDVTFSEACKNFGAMPLVRPLSDKGEPFYRSIIIVRDDSPIRALTDLKGKSFAFGDPHSTSGNLIPRDYLFRHGITLFDLKTFATLGSHDAVAKDVLKGKFDAGAVKDVIAYRYQSHGLRFLAISEPIPAVPIVVTRDTDPALVAAVKKALLAIDPTDPAQHAAMANWDPEFRHGFVPATTADYQHIFDLMAGIKDGCGSRCH